MVGSLALERRVGTSYNIIKTFLSNVLPAYLSNLVTLMSYGNENASRHDTAQATHINGQPSDIVVEPSQELQSILQNPEWEMARTLNQREALVVNSLAKLGYQRVSGLYNPKGRHAIFGKKEMLVSLDVMRQTYTPANGSIPHDMMQVLDKAGFKSAH